MTYVKGFIGGGIDCANTLCQVLINVLIGVLSIRGIILQGALLDGGNLCGGLSNGLGSMARLLLSFSSSKPYFEKIMVHAEDARTGADTGPEQMSSAITVENLSFRYGERPILQEMSLRFQKGGKYALTGPSGCGKSTLLKLLLGWLPDYDGTIRFDGKDIRDFTPEQLQQQMSYIEQDVFLFNSTIRDNITLGETFPEAQMERALRDSALDQKNADIVEKSLLDNAGLTLILVSHHLTPERKGQFTQVYDLQPAALAPNNNI